MRKINMDNKRFDCLFFFGKKSKLLTIKPWTAPSKIIVLKNPEAKIMECRFDSKSQNYKTRIIRILLTFFKYSFNNPKNLLLTIDCCHKNITYNPPQARLQEQPKQIDEQKKEIDDLKKNYRKQKNDGSTLMVLTFENLQAGISERNTCCCFM